MKKNIKGYISFTLLILLLPIYSYCQQQPQSNIKPDDVKKWLQKNMNLSTPYKNETIKKVLETALFDDMYVEPHDNNENFIIIPLKKEYFSQHSHTGSSHPLQYLLVVENSKGKIRKSDIVLFYSNDTSLAALPKNSFHNFFNSESLSVDGTFIVISLGDVRYFEMDFKNREKVEFRLWHHKNGQNEKQPECGDWYLSTTIYHVDGTVSLEEKFLGATCTSCPPNFVCDTKEQ